MTAQKSYYRVRLGEKHKHVDECYQGEFFGIYGSPSDGFDIDLSKNTPEKQKVFNKKFSDIFLKHNPDATLGKARNACNAIWAISRKIKEGDIVLCPSTEGEYRVGEVIGDYVFQDDQSDSLLRHRRKVKWLPITIACSNMSLDLKKSTDSITTIISIEKHAEEIEKFISGESQPQLITTDESIEDASEFVLEKHLGDFLVKNWKSTEIGKKYEIIGQEYKTYTGSIDILAISKDKKEYLVVELKKGQASDRVVGQILKYIGDIQQDLAEPWQKVRGAIIAFGDNKHFNRALGAVENIDFYEYKVNFSLSKK